MSGQANWDVSGKSFERAKPVVEAAEEDPEAFSDLVEQMDAGGKINRAHQTMQQRQMQQQRQAQGERLTGDMGILVGDFRVVGDGLLVRASTCCWQTPPFTNVSLYGDLAQVATACGLGACAWRMPASPISRRVLTAMCAPPITSGCSPFATLTRVTGLSSGPRLHM